MDGRTDRQTDGGLSRTDGRAGAALPFPPWPGSMLGLDLACARSRGAAGQTHSGLSSYLAGWPSWHGPTLVWPSLAWSAPSSLPPSLPPSRDRWLPIRSGGCGGGGGTLGSRRLRQSPSLSLSLSFCGSLDVLLHPLVPWLTPLPCLALALALALGRQRSSLTTNDDDDDDGRRDETRFQP